MYAQSAHISTLFLIGIAVILATMAYYLLSGMLTKLYVSTETKGDVVLPPVAQGVSSFPTGDRIVFCVYLYNPNERALELNGSRVLYKGMSFDTFSLDCNRITPGDVCTICAEMSEEEYSVGSHAQLIFPEDIPPIPVKLPEPVAAGLAYLDYFVKSFSLSYSYYGNPIGLDGNELNVVLASGDINKVYLVIDARHSFSTSVQLEGNCVRQVSLSLELNAGRNVVELSEVNVPPGSRCRVELNLSGVPFTYDTVVWRSRLCFSKDTCETALSEANSSLPIPSIIILTSDIENNHIKFPSIVDYGWRLIFDGNGHEISNPGEGALSLFRDNGVYLTRLALGSNNETLYLYESSAAISYTTMGAIRDSVVVENSSAYFARSSLYAQYGALSCSWGSISAKDINVEAYVGGVSLYRCEGYLEDSRVHVNALGVAVGDANIYITGSNIEADQNIAVSCRGQCHFVALLDKGDVRVLSSGYDWYTESYSILRVCCNECDGAHHLFTDLLDKGGFGVLTHNCDVVTSRSVYGCDDEECFLPMGGGSPSPGWELG